MISIRHHPLTLLVVATISSPVLYGQDATVRRATAETTDGIVVTVELTRQNLRFGQNIVANYRVKNNSKSPIYFRRKGPLDVWSSGRTIVIDVPLPWPIEHGEYDYIFVEVKPNQTSQARFVLTEKDYKKSVDWILETVFAYVRDVTGLRRSLGTGEDPAGLRSQLATRTASLHVTGLFVRIE